MLAALGLPTPASMPPSVAAAAAAAFPFHSRPAVTSRCGVDDEIMNVNGGEVEDEETIAAEGDVRECLENASHDISTLPAATATVN